MRLSLGIVTVFASSLLLLAAVSARGQQESPAPAPPHKPRIMITAFEPFEGRAENNSTRISAMLAAHPELYPGVEITVCSLPVVYDEGAASALACMDKMAGKPDIVLSLGEVGCKVRLETVAKNEDDVPGSPDNAGNIRSHRPIVDGGPERMGYDLPVQAMFCALSKKDRKKVGVSNTMNYVCNNTAYLLATKLRGTGIPYGFVHVPTTECGDDADPLANARLIARMLDGALAHERVERSATYALPHCSNEEHIPTSLEELSRAAASIAAAENGAACEREFLDRLKELM